MHTNFELGLTRFVEHYVSRKDGVARDQKLQALTGDAGFRRYYRVSTQPSMIAVYSPPETEKNTQFLAVAEALRKNKVRSPIVIDLDLDRGFFLLEDFGDRQLLQHLDSDSVDGLYDIALDTLHALQHIPCDRKLFPIYDESKLIAEMSLFTDWYLHELLGISIGADDHDIIRAAMNVLAQRALSQAQVAVHRDYHSRNLMVLDDGGLGVIDFQDAVIGPVTYDLVSLLKDCYVRWDAKRVEDWALSFYERSFYERSFYEQSSPVLSSRQVVREPLREENRAHFLKDFHFMGLQRHLKVLGIFARLYLRDGKARYLDDLPRVTEYVLEVTKRFPELADLHAFLESKVVPIARQRGWA